MQFGEFQSIRRVGGTGSEDSKNTDGVGGS